MNAQYLLYPYEFRQRVQRVTVDRVWGRIGSVPNPFALLNGISRGLIERRIMLWSRFRPEQRLFQQRDWSGRVLAHQGDYFLLNHQNLGVDKLDYYLRESVRYRAEIQTNGDVDVEVTVEMRNTAPPGLPEPVGNNDGSKMRTLVGPFVPPGAELLDVTVDDDNVSLGDGSRPKRRAEGYGKRLFQTIVKVDPRSRAIVTYRYRIPGALIRSPEGDAYRLTIQHQPLAHPAELALEIVPPPGRSFAPLPVGWTTDGETAIARTPLNWDLVVVLALE